MWEIKTFKMSAAMIRFIERNRGKIQWHEVFINNTYAIEYRKLRVISVG